MSNSYDAIIIGGGINGCGLARDLAMRGLRVALVEKHDIGSGTSANSSGMIHGGARYLLYEMNVTRSSSTDAGYIRRIAKHLTFRIPFLLPTTKRMSWLYIEGLESFWEAYDEFQPLKEGKKHTRLGRKEALQIEPGLADDVTGAISFDEWGIDGSRLCIANAVDARERGASFFTHREVKGFLRAGDRVAGVELGDGTKLESAVTLNLAGPWAPRVGLLAGVEIKMRPSKGIHVVFPRRISNYSIMAQAIDGRHVWLQPHLNYALLGTTDEDYFGETDGVGHTQDEVRYLIDAVSRVYPRLREHRYIRTIVGIRPTLWGYGMRESKLSRNHAIYDHKADGADGLITMIGGKLASYREMAEELAGVVCKKLGVTAECRTHIDPLPGGDRLPDHRELSEAFEVPPIAITHLIGRQGSRAKLVLEVEERAPRSVVCPCEPVLACEVAHAIRQEGAQSVDDLRRRTRLGEGECQGTICIGRAAPQLHESGIGVDRVHRSVREALEERFRGRMAALDQGGANLAQEELLQSRYFLVGDYRRAVS